MGSIASIDWTAPFCHGQRQPMSGGDEASRDSLERGEVFAEADSFAPIRGVESRWHPDAIY